MRLLFEIDTKDYDTISNVTVRPSARCIAIRDGRVAMIHSLKYDYYKFPGGGIEQGETLEQAAIRETLEEAGLAVIAGSVREYGYVHRIQKSTLVEDEVFVQDNYYFTCRVEEKAAGQQLDDYEAEEQFTPRWVTPREAISANRRGGHGPKDRNMLEREAKVLEMLLAEGWFG